MREWNAETYHRVSNPQFDWGMVVLARLPLDGGEFDVGCGTGRLTEQLLAAVAARLRHRHRPVVEHGERRPRASEAAW